MAQMRDATLVSSFGFMVRRFPFTVLELVMALLLNCVTIIEIVSTITSIVELYQNYDTRPWNAIMHADEVAATVAFLVASVVKEFEVG